MSSPAYDVNGNRTRQTFGAASNTYAVDPGSNRINSFSTATYTLRYAYDASGNVLSDGLRSYSYDPQGGCRPPAARATSTTHLVSA